MSIRVEVWNGKPIDHPGVFSGVDMKTYHGPNLCVGPSISSSGLRTIFTKSAMEYWIRSPYNSSALTPIDSRAFIIGRCAHHLILGEADFKKHFIVRPEMYPDQKTGELKKWNLQANFCKKWEAEARDDLKLEIITPAEMEVIKGMAGIQPWQKGLEDSGLMNNALVRAGALNGLVEHTVIGFDRETGVWLKSRPDCIPTDSAEGNDFKSCASVDEHSLIQSLNEFRYDIQASLFATCLEQAADIRMTNFSLIFASKTEPHEIAVRELIPLDLDEAKKDMDAAIRTFALCMETGRWPGVGGGEEDARFLSRTDRSRERAALRREQLSRFVFG